MSFAEANRGEVRQMPKKKGAKKKGGKPPKANM